MQTWSRRIRAALGIAFVWGIAGSFAGFIAARVVGVVSDVPPALILAPLAAATGLIFSAVLSLRTRSRGFDQLSFGRMSLWGASSGLALGAVIGVGALVRGAGFLGDFLLFGPFLAALGAAGGAGTLALARRAERRELPREVP
jgi:hypothetical protein